MENNSIRIDRNASSSAVTAGIFHEDLRAKMADRLSAHTANPDEAVRVVEDTLAAYLAAALAGGLMFVGTKLVEKIRSRYVN